MRTLPAAMPPAALCLAILAAVSFQGCERMDRPSPTQPDVIFEPTETYPESLHATARGMRTLFTMDGAGPYDQGIGTWSGLDYESVSCKDCHAVNGPPRDYCSACHGNDRPREDATCYPCHSRQEYVNITAAESDIHRDSRFQCVDCHRWGDYHGDGTSYPTQLAKGSERLQCTDCHAQVKSSPSHDAHKDANGNRKIYCSACHTRTVVTCYNCHFDTFIATDVKKAIGKYTNWVFLINDGNTGKVKPATFQSVAYENGAAGDKFICFAPFESHTIMGSAEMTASRPCTACHGTSANSALQEFDASNKITATAWTGSAVSHMTGVIPVPCADGTSGAERLDFVYLGLSGAVWTPLVTLSEPKVQYAYCTPFTQAQMDSIIKGPLPAVTSVVPAAAAGGSSVTITGTGFWKYSSVTFDGTAATSVVLVNSTTITCVVPPHSAGLVDVIVTNAAGFSATLTGGFTYE